MNAYSQTTDWAIWQAHVLNDSHAFTSNAKGLLLFTILFSLSKSKQMIFYRKAELDRHLLNVKNYLSPRIFSLSFEG